MDIAVYISKNQLATYVSFHQIATCTFYIGFECLYKMFKQICMASKL